VLRTPQASVPANYSPSKLDAPPSDLECPLICCTLVQKSVSFWYLQCSLLTKMLQVGVRTLTSSCFGFACTRAQGTRHRRRRQVPCPLPKMIGRNRLQEFKHSFNQKKWPGVTNNQSSVIGFADLPDGSPLLHSLSLKYEHLWRLISLTTSLTFLESSLSNCSNTNCKHFSCQVTMMNEVMLHIP